MSPHSHALLNYSYQLYSIISYFSQFLDQKTLALIHSSKRAIFFGEIAAKKSMGNCIETCKNSPETDKNPLELEEVKSEQENGTEKGGNMRIKIVLTKEELEWLMFQLKTTEGKRLEDVLGEIQRSRDKTVAWKPSLDSIIESPEVPEGMDR